MSQTTTQQKLEETLARYVAMPTVTNNIEACSDAIKVLAAEFGALGMTTHTDGPIHPWLITTSRPEAMLAKQVKVLFVIHFDVVPFENDAQAMLQSGHGKLFGRGVYDMKFAAACVKEMAASLAKNSAITDYDFGVLITTDEEKGGYNGAAEFLKQGWRCDIGVIPDGGDNWTIERRAKGLHYINLVAYGRTAHSARPWLGDNPIKKLTPALNEIIKKFANEDPHAAIVSVNSLTTSNSHFDLSTQIPGWAKAGISIRAFSVEEAVRAAHIIEELAKKHKVAAQTALNEPPVHLVESDPLVQMFIKTANAVHGSEVSFSDALAASDARHFALYDIPTVQMYPTGGDHHGPHEWIARDDLYTYFKLCEQFCLAAAQLPQPSVVSIGRR